VRRLVQGLAASEQQRQLLVWWSRFRRSHQARAIHCHTQHRACQAPPVARADVLPLPIPLPGLPALTDALWEQLRPLFEPAQPRRGRPTERWRRRLEAVLWISRTASAWRQLPDHFGPWETVVYHYRRWCKDGLWDRVLQILLSQDASHAARLSLPAP
jgi:transposase